MKIYAIFEPVRGPARLDDPRSVVFLKQGFCWPALFVPIVWMLYHRLWLASGGYVVLSAMVALLGQYVGANDASAGIIGLGFGLMVAWEANGLRRRSLDRAGFREVATVAAKNLPLAEARYFAERAALTPEAPDQVAAPVRAPGFDQRRTGMGWGFAAPDALR